MSIVLSEKFQKELEQFFDWVSVSYTCKFKDEERVWNIDLVEHYQEPSRNKLEMFIKAIMSTHSIKDSSDIQIKDAKLLAKDYKENGKGKKGKKVVKEKKIKTEKITKDVKKGDVKKGDVKKENEELKIVSDVNLDTTGTWYVSDVKQNTQELEKYFGCKPNRTGNQFDDHQYEWKFRFGGNLYSIYDWAYEDGSFEDYDCTIWCLAGNSENKEMIEKIHNELESYVRENSKSNVKREFKTIDEYDNNGETFGESDDNKDLFGESDDEDDDIEINILGMKEIVDDYSDDE